MKVFPRANALAVLAVIAAIAAAAPVVAQTRHDHTIRTANHRHQSRHRRFAEDRADLRDALYRLAL